MEKKTVPVAEEKVEVGKVRRSSTVTVRKTSHMEERPVEASLEAERIEVERVPADRLVDGPVPDRWEGDTLVVSVLEEVLVVEKRLRVVEELRITRRIEEDIVHETVPVRVETAEVDRRDDRPSG